MAAGRDRAGRPSYEELQALVAQQAARIAGQDAVIAALRGQSAEQRAMIVELKTEIAELQARLDIAVGTALRLVGSGCPPRRSRRALLTHRAPPLGIDVETRLRPGVQDAGRW